MHVLFLSLYFLIIVNNFLDESQYDPNPSSIKSKYLEPCLLPDKTAQILKPPSLSNCIVGLLGPDSGSKELLAKQISQLPALSATARRVQTEVSPKVAREGVGTRFLHPWDV